MKNILIAILIIGQTAQTPVSGQNTNSLFTDINFCHGPGLSLIYTRIVHENTSIGLGVQLLQDNVYHVKKAALFGDVRFQWPMGNALLFFHGNVGLDLHDSYVSKTGIAPTLTLYTGLGLGYSYILNDYGIGPYVEIRFWGDGYKVNEYDYAREEMYSFYNMDVIPVIALGFKF